MVKTWWVDVKEIVLTAAMLGVPLLTLITLKYGYEERKTMAAEPTRPDSADRQYIFDKVNTGKRDWDNIFD
ncbi:MAG: hypothetical protein WC686_03425 [Candidatus Shapirobacteria bacterium]|jgi:hypothetical protein